MSWLNDKDLKQLREESLSAFFTALGRLTPEQKVELNKLRASLCATRIALAAATLAYWRAQKKQGKERTQLIYMVLGGGALGWVLDFFGLMPKLDLMRVLVGVGMVALVASWWTVSEIKISGLENTMTLLERDWSSLNQSRNWGAAAIAWERDTEKYGDEWPDEHILRHDIIKGNTELALINLITDKHETTGIRLWWADRFSILTTHV